MHFKNPSRSKMLVSPVVLLAATVFCISPSLASHHNPPKSGVTDAKVRSLGEGAEEFMVGKLSDTKEERHYSGLISQLARLAHLDKEDSKTTRALIDFVERQTQKDEISIPTLKAVAQVIQFLAYRGGAEGVKYAGAWIDGSKIASAHIRGDKGSLPQVWIKKSAVRGLAWSNRDDAQSLRKKLRGNLPSGDQGRSLKGLLDETDKEHSKVMERGLEASMKEWGMR